MRLIYCKIKGFGTLENLRIDFSEQVHCMYEKNGYGKSTLFDFIQAMLYGMRTRKANAANMMPREHYKPFGDATYGGELGIEADGKAYHIKRIFHEKSETMDSCLILDDTGADITSQFPENHNLGQYFFGIDEDAFKRTVAFTGQTFSSGAGENETISQKLNTMATSVDPKRKEKAIKALEEQKNSISKRGKNPGRVIIIENEMKELNNEVARLEAIANALPDKHEALSKMQDEHKANLCRMEEVLQSEAMLARWEAYEKMLVDVQRKATEKEALERKHPDTIHIPSMEEINELERLQNERHTAEANLANHLFASEKMPSEEEMAEIANQSKEYKENEIRLQTIASTPQTEKIRTSTIILGLLCVVSIIVVVLSPSVVTVIIMAALIILTVIQFFGQSRPDNTEGVRIKQRNAILENTLREFFSCYKKHGTDFKAYYDELCRDIRCYNEFFAKKEAAVKRLNEILLPFNITLEDLNVSELRIAAIEYANDHNRIRRLSDEISRERDSIVRYKEDNKLTVKPVKDETVDIESLKGNDKRLMADITRLSDDIKDDEDKVSETDFLIEKRDNLDEERTALLARLEIINKTIDFIETANRNMLETYVGPIKDKYVGFMKELIPRLSSVTMDHNYKVSIRLDGDSASRSSEHLSTGERACLELSLRLALIDNMYKKERPFLMMDDPFADLDEENLEKAKRIVKCVSKTTQVLYFCCFESRRIF